jgi:hypothetical protein
MKKLFTILVSLLVTASVYSQTYNVNTFYAELGGYVIQTDGTHGVVVAMQDQGTSTWYNYDALINNPANYDENGSKFSDWRLPTKDELNLAYLQKQSIGGFINTLYWSSTEYDEFSRDAWKQNFYDGFQYIWYKGTTNYVRAVRNF